MYVSGIGNARADVDGAVTPRDRQLSVLSAESRSIPCVASVLPNDSLELPGPIGAAVVIEDSACPAAWLLPELRFVIKA